MSKRRRHPLARVAGTVARLPRYVSLGRRLAADGRIAPWRKAVLAASLGYVAMPLDLVPGIIPVAGQLDDLAALLLGLRVALAGCGRDDAAAHLRAAGLSRSALDADLRNVGVAAAWLGRGGLRLGARAGMLPLRLAGAIRGRLPLGSRA